MSVGWSVITSRFWALRAKTRADFSYCPCPATILPLPTRTRLMLPCIRPCSSLIRSQKNRRPHSATWDCLPGLIWGASCISSSTPAFCRLPATKRRMMPLLPCNWSNDSFDKWTNNFPSIKDKRGYCLGLRVHGAPRLSLLQQKNYQNYKKSVV